MATEVTGALLALDVVLAVSLVGCAAALVATADVFKATVLFIVFGVMMALVWGRLGAVDVALAEAAIGAGITGALLLGAQTAQPARRRGAAARGREHTFQPATPDDAPVYQPARPSRRVAAALAAAAVAGVVLLALSRVPTRHPGLAPILAPHMPDAGAENPVTVVLLSVRAYDTLLEIVVLLAAVIAAWASAVPAAPKPEPPGALLAAATRVMVPVAVLIGGYLLWRGAAAPGGAFQAGAVIAGAGILAAFAGVELPRRGGAGLIRAGLVAATLVFLGAGAYGPARGEPFLHYRGGAAEGLILVIEVVATLSIALSLVGVFMGRPPPRTPERTGGDDEFG